MQTSTELSNIATALCKAQGELRDIEKNKHGYGYKYATLESILNMARPVLLKNGLAIIQSHGNDGDLITVTTRILHTSGEWLEDTGGVPFQLLKGMNNAQSVGSAITYERRYQICSFLNITSDEDIDGKPDVMQQKGKNEEKPQQETISGYLQSKGLNAKNSKQFCLKYNIKSAEDAQKALQDKAGLNALIDGFERLP